jgi:hypothetical protein
MDFPGEKLLIRLWETVERSGVGLAQPWHLTRVAKAEAIAASYRMVAIAEAEKKIAEILKEPPNDLATPLLLTAKDNAPNLEESKREPVFDLNEFARQATRSQTLEYLRKEVNIEKAVLHAEQALKDDSTDPPDSVVDADWFFRWRDFAGGMSSEALQQLWGNVLAGELKNPGSFAFRTLDFLRSLSQDEAKLIERLACTVIEKVRVIYAWHRAPLAEAEPIPNHLSSSELALLDELGVISGFSSMGYFDNAEPFHTQDGRHVHLLACMNRGLFMLTENPKKTTGLAFYQLTKLGESLMQLIHAAPNEAYLWSLGEMLARGGFEVEIVDVVPYSDNTRRTLNGVSIPAAAKSAANPD